METGGGKMTVWFTGLPCSGKTTLATVLLNRLLARHARAELLDGDVIRGSLWPELGFSMEDRITNVHRLGYLARLLSRHNVVAIIAAVSPYRASRDEVRRMSDNGFMEVYVNAPLEVCERRDVKGMYAKARRQLAERHDYTSAVSAGYTPPYDIERAPHFTGIDDPYEPPLHPELEVHTDTETILESVDRIMLELEPVIHATTR
jgi:adenylylsulfate kinase